MAEKNKAQLLEEIKELQAQIEKMTTDAGVSEVMAEKDSKIAELSESLDKANDQLEGAKESIDNLNAENEALKKINEELSAQNSSVASDSGNIVELNGEKFECIAKSFYDGSQKVTIEELRKNKSKASKAKELGYLIPLTEK